MSELVSTTSRRFSIIIPHRNGEEVIRSTLTALMKIIVPEDEIIVVDNGSCDASVLVIRAEFPTVQLHTNKYNGGFASACNQGLRAAAGQYLLLLNNDAQLAPGVLERFIHDLEHQPQAGLIGGQLVDHAGNRLRSDRRLPTFRSECGLSRPDQGVGVGSGIIEVEQIAGACMAMRRNFLNQIGLLDERFFFYFEDTEFCWRVRRLGWRVLLDTEAKVIHDLDTSPTRQRREAQLEYLRSRLLYYRIAFPIGIAISLICYRFLRICLYFLTSLAATLITVGHHAKSRQKLSRHAYFLHWFFQGCPKDWGLPGKKPG